MCSGTLSGPAVPIITWTGPALSVITRTGPVQKKSNFSIPKSTFSETLVLNQVRTSYAGNYTCNAFIGATSMSASIYVAVSGKNFLQHFDTLII